MFLPSTIHALREQLNRTTSITERLALLETIARGTLDYNPAEALVILNEGLALATERRRTAHRGRFHRMIGICRSRLGEPADAIESLKNACAMFQSCTSPEEEAETRVELGRIAADYGVHETGIQAYHSGLELFSRLHNHSGELAALKGLSDLHQQLGDWHTALNYVFQVLETARTIQDTREQGIALSDMGVLYAQLGEYQRALHCLSESISSLHQCGEHHLEIRALVNKVGIQSEHDSINSALETGLKGLALCEALNDRGNIAVLLVNLSNLYERQEQLETALDMRIKAARLFEELNDVQRTGTALLGLGNLYRKIGRSEQALRVLEHALEFAERSEDKNTLISCHEILSCAHEETGSLPTALAHVRMCLELTRNNEQNKRRREIATQQNHFDLKRAEQEREIFRQRNEQLEKENQERAAELTTLSTRLLEQSRLLRDVRSIMEDIGEGNELQQHLQARELTRAIRQSTENDQDWERFREAIDLVHRNFIAVLGDQFPSLTPSELRVCALVRLGLSSAEIADILHVTKRNVDTHRYRLRKKLELNGRASLVRFLANIELCNGT